METELKLAIAAKDIPRLKSHSVLAKYALGGPDERHQVDTYYDTPARDLLRNGYALRVRSSASESIQTLKDAGTASGGLHVRGEWEGRVSDGKPAPAALAHQAGRHSDAGKLLLSAEVAEHLAPIFTTNTIRTIWNLRLPAGDRVECALDVGKIRSGKRQASITEVELELKKGDPARLFDLALDLGKTMALRVENESKAERGYALLGGEPRFVAVKATRVRLSGRRTLEEAFQRIVMNCLEQIEANMRGVLAQDIDCLHQMRVGLRRLRAALRLFDKLAPLPANMAEELDWLSRLLGDARDWDVFISSTLEKIGTEDWAAQRDILRHTAQEYSIHAHREVGSALRSRRYTHLVLAFSRWVVGRQWREQEAGPPEMFTRTAQEGISPLLRKAQRRLRQRIRRADCDDAGSRHRVRIAAKKYRYTAEFFLSMLPTRPLKKLVRRLTALQDLLGTLNDITVADKLLEKLDHESTHQQVAYAQGYLAAVVKEKIAKLKRPLKDASDKHRW